MTSDSCKMQAQSTGKTCRDEEENMPAGRPTKYKPEMCEIVIREGGQGKTLVGMADALDIQRETLNEWMKIHPEFSDSVKMGLRKSQAWWEEQGRLATFGGIEGFNATSYIFQMKNRFRAEWNDTVKSEHSGTDGGPLTIQWKNADN